MVVSPIRFCIHNPVASPLANRGESVRSSIQTSSRERTRSLPNRNLNLCDKDLAAKAPGNLGRVRGLEEQRERFH